MAGWERETTPASATQAGATRAFFGKGFCSLSRYVFCLTSRFLLVQWNCVIVWEQLTSVGFRLADVRNQVCSVRRAQKEMRMFKVIHILGCFCEMGHYELFSRGPPPPQPKHVRCMSYRFLIAFICLKLVSKYLHVCICVFDLYSLWIVTCSCVLQGGTEETSVASQENT